MLTKPNCFTLDSNFDYYREYDSTKGPENGWVAHNSELPVMNFDYSTIFYDAIFLEGHNKIIISGPPLLNLTDRFLRFDLHLKTSNGTEVLKPTRTFTGSHVYIWEFFTTADTVKDGHAQFAQGQRELIQIRTVKQQKRKITLTTLQKDNPVQWIIDWVNFHSQIGVDHFVIYDNGSSYQDALEEQISTALPNVQVEVIAWNFPYGPTRHGQMKFCQVGQLNHCLTSNVDCEWLLNLDVDEYLILENGKKGIEEFVANIDPKIGLVHIPGRVVVNTNDSARTLELTVRDFSYIDKKPQKIANKFLVRTAAAYVLHIHSAKIFEKYEELTLPLENLCFFHYKSLTTNWQQAPTPARTRQQRIQDNVHEKSMIVQTILERK